MNKKTVEVKPQDLPISCPNNDMELWSSHPKVYLNLSKTGEACCPYCCTKYVLTSN